MWRGNLEACNGELVVAWTYQRAIGSLIGVVVPREIAASVDVTGALIIVVVYFDTLRRSRR